MIDADGTVRPVLSGDALGGTPLDVSFTADGRLVDVFVAAPGDEAGGSTWRIVQVDPADGTRATEAIAGTECCRAGDLTRRTSLRRRSTARGLGTDDEFPVPIVLDLGIGEARRRWRSGPGTRMQTTTARSTPARRSCGTTAP